MSHTPHDLAADFPTFTDRIRRLKSEDAHFARLVEEYHDVNRDIHRAETNVTPVDDMHDIEMRKTRMRLKDQIARTLGAIV